MKSRSFLLIVALMILGDIFSQEPQPVTYPLDQMITIINNSLDKANKRLDSIDIRIQNAEITFQTILDKSGGGGFKIFVKASKTWALEKASTLTFTFEKIEEPVKEFFRGPNEPVFEENLTNAIVDAAKQWKNITKQVNGLSKKDFQVEISFSVTNVTIAGIEFEIYGVGVDLSGDYEKQAIHKISLTFK